MPSALYTLSYQDTGSILSFCVLEKQTLADAAAVKAFRDQLVGNTFLIRLSTSPTSPGIQIQATDLALDEIDIEPQLIPAFVRDPNAKVLDLPDSNAIKPGDGKPKQLKAAEELHTFTLDHTTQTLIVQATSIRSVKTPLYSFVDGAGPAIASIAVSTKDASLPLPVPVQHNHTYPIAFFGRGLKTFIGVKRAA
ncbi:MAG: hypothetical protein ACM31C_31310 [Acidobacteriota bacterium]